ncbi:MAG: hypothetical protein E7543_06065 [Ruminococcaceae bacterium]|nr:hypothetical protein [Oscillospiraceae bacterium]
MKKDRFELFSKISLWITTYYFISNLFVLPLWWGTPIFNIFHGVFLIPFYIDLFTWHIFGVFSVVAFIVKITVWVKRGELFKKNSIRNLILHIFYTVAAFGEIWWIFENSF